MASSSSGSVRDIINDIEDIENALDPEDEPGIEDAEPVERPQGNALDVVSLDELDKLPTLQDAREAANIPPHVQIKDLVGREIVVARKTEQKAANPETGKLTDGFFCDIIDIELKKALTVWIGQIVLKRELMALELPFITRIIKRGRTYIFS